MLTTIADLQHGYANGLSPVSVTESCLQRIADHNAALRAMIFVDAEGALMAARQADSEMRAGRSRGPLHGVPVAVKDLIDVAECPTTGGSRLFGGQVATSDARCVARLKEAGAIILGKTNMHELAVGGHANPWFGKVVNPLDETRGTGGSSSGSAAAVAAGFCIAAVGTDSGGSNRSPAAGTGLVGFKPSADLIETTGSRPTAPSLDTIGPIAACINDAQRMAEAMCGRALIPNADKSGSGSEIVLGFCPDLYADVLDATVEHSIQDWLEDCRRRENTTMREFRFRQSPALVDAGLAILKFEFARAFQEDIENSTHLVGDPVLAFLESAREIDEQRYTLALVCRDSMKREFFKAMGGIDAIAVPTAPGLAPRLADDLTRVGDGYTSYSAAGARFRLWANMLGMPALALPLPTDEALPASIQIAGMPGSDGDLFRVASTLFESANGF